MGMRRPKAAGRVTPANVSGGETPFPVRGVSGGWRDVWDDPNDHAQLRAEAGAVEENRVARAPWLGALLRLEREQATAPVPGYPASDVPLSRVQRSNLHGLEVAQLGRHGDT